MPTKAYCIERRVYESIKFLEQVSRKTSPKNLQIDLV